MEDIHKHLVSVNNRISIHNHKEKKQEMRSSNHTAHSLMLKHHFDYENHSKKKHYEGGSFNPASLLGILPFLM